MSTVDVRKAPRRELALRSVEDIASELERIADAHEAGELGTTGNWTPGENLDHVVKFMEMSMDGFPERAPFVLRAIAWACKPLLLMMMKDAKPPKPGTFDNRGKADFIEPTPGADAGEAIARGRRMIERLRAGERFAQLSPLFGRFSHEQWVTVHASHCNLHWSFLTLGEAG